MRGALRRGEVANEKADGSRTSVEIFLCLEMQGRSLHPRSQIFTCLFKHRERLSSVCWPTHMAEKPGGRIFTTKAHNVVVQLQAVIG